MALAMPWVHHTAAQSRKPKYVREYKDRHGVNRLEFRRKGIKGWPLRPPLRSDAFWEDYNAALAGGIPPGVASRGQRLPVATTGSMRWLCIGYKKSAAFKRLDITTQTRRGAILDRFCQEHGDKPFTLLERAHLLKIRDKIADTPEAANGMIKALRQVFKYAVEYDYLTVNPARDIDYLPSNNPGGFHAWTVEELDQFEAAHPIGTKAHLALALMM